MTPDLKIVVYRCAAGHWVLLLRSQTMSVPISDIPCTDGYVEMTSFPLGEVSARIGAHLREMIEEGQISRESAREYLQDQIREQFGL